MQWLAEICVRRPVFAVMLIAALVVAGIAFAVSVLLLAALSASVRGVDDEMPKIDSGANDDGAVATVGEAGR